MEIFDHSILKIDDQIIKVRKSKSKFLMELLTGILLIFTCYVLILYPFRSKGLESSGKLHIDFYRYNMTDWVFFFSPLVLLSPLILRSSFKLVRGDDITFDSKSKEINLGKKVISFHSINEVVLDFLKQESPFGNSKNKKDKYKLVIKFNGGKKIKIINSEPDDIFNLINYILDKNIKFVNETNLVNPKYV